MNHQTRPSTRFWCETPSGSGKHPSRAGQRRASLARGAATRAGRSPGCRLGDHPQIVGDEPPADPALHPVVAVVAAAVELVLPFEPADASLDPRPPVVSPPEPALLLEGDPLGRLRPQLRDNDLLDLPWLERAGDRSAERSWLLYRLARLRRFADPP